jgi:hypothetical protein
MLTAREHAASLYATVVAQGRRRILGRGDDMGMVTEQRLANVRAATRKIAAARGTERVLSREPDDATLDQMLERVRSLEAQLEADLPRWLS